MAKFTQDELTQIKELQTKYAQSTDAFGRLRVQRLILNQQMDQLEDAEVRLENDYTDLQKSEQEMVQSLNEKYGAGSLDINTGEFVPSQAPAATETPAATEETPKGL